MYWSTYSLNTKILGWKEIIWISIHLIKKYQTYMMTSNDAINVFAQNTVALNDETYWLFIQNLYLIFFQCHIPLFLLSIPFFAHSRFLFKLHFMILSLHPYWTRCSTFICLTNMLKFYILNWAYNISNISYWMISIPRNYTWIPNHFDI